jgi:hypothetical protein
MEKQSMLYDLLKLIHQYYPVGLPYRNNGYDGYKSLKTIIGNNCNAQIDGKIVEPWNSLLKKLQHINPEHRYMDVSAIAIFPSQKFASNFYTSDENFTIRRSWLNGVISLIGNYYCVWIEEELITRMEDGSVQHVAKMPRAGLTEEERKEINEVHDLIKTCYPAYIHVDFDLLQVKVHGAIPIGEDSETMVHEFPIFDFLFGGN